MAELTIDVIIPVYQGEPFLGQAVESVLAQSYPATRLIVIDDGSTDGTAQVATRFGARVHYVYQDHQGIAPARNRGVELAQGDYLAFLDADDLWSAEKLERQVAAVSVSPAPDMVFGHVRHFHDPALTDKVKAQVYCPPEPMPGYALGTLLM